MTSWRPDGDALRGRIAVVAGATRGAGRGIAVALGEAGATVICTGRSSRGRSLQSDYDRPETIEETAELVWRDAAAPPGFAVSESPRYVGRAVVALADARRGRWNQHSVTSAQLAAEYGFTDIDGSRPDVWSFTEAIEHGRHDADPADFRW